MGSGNRSIRFKIFLLLLLPLLSLSALWGFVLNLTVGDGAALLRAGTLYDTVGVTSADMGLQLQAERARSTVAVSSRVVTTELGTQRLRTDESVTKFRDAAVEAGDAVGEELRAPLDTLLRELDRLRTIRADIDSGKSTRLTVLRDYNRLLDQVFLLYDRLVAVPDVTIFQQAAALQAIGNAQEMMARENALITGALVDDRLSAEEHAAFADYVATRRFLAARGRAALDPELRGPYEDVFASPTYQRFEALENAISAGGRGGVLPAEAKGWPTTTGDLSGTLDQLRTSSSDVLAERVIAVANGIRVRIAVAGGLGLLAVLASIIVSVRFAGRLSQELGRVRAAALDLAERRLPAVVERLRRGEEVDVAAEAPPIETSGPAEIADVARAVGSVQRTAVAAAVGQANLRRGVAHVFVSLARRKQALLHRQLTLLDGMQRRTDDPDTLDDLYRLDHLTTRMRRHAEGLIILSGAIPGRAWRRPIPMVDVVRAAVAEIEDYKRVKVSPMADVALDGSAVADVVHLVAELMENATIYSPPHTTVSVRGESVANGFAIEVEDRGLGLSAEEYAAINERLADPPEFDLTDSDRLGLFVVGQLATRHGINVILRASPYGGTTAIALIPRALVAEPAVPATVTPAVSPPTLTAARLDPDGRRPGGVPPARHEAEQPEQRDAGRGAAAGPHRSDTERLDERVPDAAVGRAARDPGATPGPTPAPEAAPVREEPADRSSDTSQHSPLSAVSGPPARSRVGGTHAGLPRRVRQANLAPQLRQGAAEGRQDDRPDAATEPPGEGTVERSPDEVRALFSAFQQGARRAREESDDYAHQTTGEKGEA